MRKIKPKKALKKKKVLKELEKQMASQINMFSHLPEECGVCKKPFDKKSREMAQTWKVTVYKKEKRVQLCCPSCWSAVIDIVKKSPPLKGEG